MMKKQLITLHTYLGLLCSGFLILYGVTGFFFQHHYTFVQPQELDAKTWEAPFTLHIENTNSLKKAILDSLGLFGHLPWWIQHTDSLGNFHFTAMRPAKKYEIIYFPHSENVQVTALNTGVWNALFGAHTSAAGGLKKPVIAVWKVLGQILALLSIFVILSSIYIWRPKNKKKLINWILFGSSFLSIFILILYIGLVG